MQAAVPAGEGAMAALLGLELAAVERVVGEGPCAVANDNAPGQVVISGARAAVEHAVAAARQRGAAQPPARRLRPVPLPADGARRRGDGRGPRRGRAEGARGAGVSNVSAAPETDPDRIRALLVRQVTGRVRWRESLLALGALGVREFVEIGAGKVLTGLVRRTLPDAPARSATPDDIAGFVEAALREMAMFDLAGRSALVTGAWGAIGEAIARPLHAQGAHVVLRGRRATRWSVWPAHSASGRRRWRRDLAAPGRRAEHQGDRGRPAARHPGQQRRHHARRPGRACADEQWQEVIDVNLTAAFRLVARGLRGMMHRRWGRIVNIASVVGVTGNPGQANYAAAKAGMIGMSKALAAEVASRGITVNCVAPGFVASPDDRDLGDEPARPRSPSASPPAGSAVGPTSPRRWLSGQRRGGVCHRPDPAREWRHGDDLARALAASLTPSQPRDCDRHDTTRPGSGRPAPMVTSTSQAGPRMHG